MKLRNARLTRSAAAAAALALVLGTFLMGAALAQESPSTSQKQTFTVGLTADIVSPNPFKACCGSEYEMMFMAYDQLLNFSKKDLTAAPGLAKSWQHNDDYTEWTFDIRDGVSWSDGQPLTSEDIAFTYRFIVDNKMGAFNDYLPFDPTFETPDDTTLIWKSSEPTFAPTVPPWVPILPEIFNNPVFGSGLGSIMWSRAMIDGRLWQVSHPHNAYLQVLMDNGVVGTVLVLAFWIWAWKAFRREARNEAQPLELRGFFEGAAAGLLAFLMAGVAGSSLRPDAAQAFTWLAFGLLVGVRAKQAALVARAKKKGK